MDYLFAVLIIIAIPGLPFLSYWILKRRGYRKFGQVLGSILFLLILALMASYIFEDELFSKRDAIKLLETQGIRLKDKFAISKISRGRGDYYFRFALQASANDKRKVIEQIKSATNFKVVSDSSDNPFIVIGDRYKGAVQTSNFETDSSFIREYFRPNGQGYAPLFYRLEITKKDSVFTFENFY